MAWTRVRHHLPGAVAILLAGLLAILPARAAEPATGGIVRDLLRIEGKQVPLPAGVWIVLGTATAPGLVSLALGRLSPSGVDAAILVQASPRRAAPAVSWGTAPGCRRTDLPFAVIRYATERDTSCVYGARVDNTTTAENVDPAWAQARAFASARSWTLPGQWEAAVFRMSDPRDAIEVHYAFPLETAGGVPALRAWAMAVWETVEDGFRNRLEPSEDTILPASPAVDAGGWPSDAGAEPSQAGNLGHLGVKMVTYRVFGTLTDLSVNYLWLGSLPSATGLAVLGAVASSTLYFVHELVWSRFEGPSDAAVALPGMGVEGPLRAVQAGDSDSRTGVRPR